MFNYSKNIASTSAVSKSGPITTSGESGTRTRDQPPSCSCTILEADNENSSVQIPMEPNLGRGFNF